MSMLSDRLSRFSPRELKFLGAGAATSIAFLLYLMVPEGEGEGVELASNPPAAVQVTRSTAMPAKAPKAAPPPAQQPASAEALVLTGIFGGGPRGGSAIILFPGGGQRVVPIGREFLPGLTLKAVGLSHAIVETAGGDIRLQLNKSGSQAVASASPAPSGTRAATQSLEAAATRRSRETLAFRMGLERTELGGGAAGYRLKSGGQIPILTQAGMQPGDTLLSVNGQAISDDERLFALSDEIAQEGKAEVKFQRNGQTIVRTIQIAR